jgi:hypothetical protein
MGLLLLMGGPSEAPFTSGLLDSFGSAAGAYSIRRLRLGYTGDCMRVRRSSDNTEQDIGFTVGGNVNTSALLSFCGSGNGFVTTWYDQSGNSQNAVQASTTAQPQVVSSGSLITDGGKLALQYDGTNDGMMTGISALTVGTSFSVFDVKKSSDTNGVFFWGNDSARWFYYMQSGSSSTAMSDRVTILSNFKNNVSQTLANRGAWFTAFGDGVRHVSSFFGAVHTNAWTDFGWCNYTAIETSATIQEIVIYASSQTANRSAINSNINSYFGVY